MVGVSAQTMQGCAVGGRPKPARNEHAWRELEKKYGHKPVATWKDLEHWERHQEKVRVPEMHGAQRIFAARRRAMFYWPVTPPLIEQDDFQCRATLRVILLVMLACLLRRHSHLLISHADLALLIGCSSSTAQRAVREARARGYIQREPMFEPVPFAGYKGRNGQEDKTLEHRQRPNAYAPGPWLLRAWSHWEAVCDFYKGTGPAPPHHDLRDRQNGDPTPDLHQPDLQNPQRRAPVDRFAQADRGVRRTGRPAGPRRAHRPPPCAPTGPVPQEAPPPPESTAVSESGAAPAADAQDQARGSAASAPRNQARGFAASAEIRQEIEAALSLCSEAPAPAADSLPEVREALKRAAAAVPAPGAVGPSTTVPAPSVPPPAPGANPDRPAAEAPPAAVKGGPHAPQRLDPGENLPDGPVLQEPAKRVGGAAAGAGLVPPPAADRPKRPPPTRARPAAGPPLQGRGGAAARPGPAVAAGRPQRLLRPGARAELPEWYKAELRASGCRPDALRDLMARGEVWLRFVDQGRPPEEAAAAVQELREAQALGTGPDAVQRIELWLRLVAQGRPPEEAAAAVQELREAQARRRAAAAWGPRPPGRGTA